ncbi:MAG: cytidine deaminase [Betaproteobacteria bacterium]
MSGTVDIEALVAAAREASACAYSPHSHFPVGAALATSDGRVFSGCNVENASFGLTICAERNAIFSAVAAGVREVQALVIYTPTSSPVTPCGACRQVLVEFGPDAQVVCACAGTERLSFKASDLLPHGFHL